MKRKPLKTLFALTLLASTSAALNAQELIIYPNKGQDKAQQEQDEFQCYTWSRDNTGFDPMKVPTASSPAPEQQGSVVGGAARGALGGAVIGAIAGDTGKGAAIGGALGGMRGGSHRRRSQQQKQQWEQEQAQQYANARSQYNRAFSACMEGRGYTVR